MEVTSNSGIAALHPAREEAPIPVAPTDRGKLNTITLPLSPIACWRVEDINFEFASSIPSPTVELGLKHLAQVMDEATKQDRPDVKEPNPISIFGHADPVGDDELNKGLAGRRAQAIYGLLIRDVTFWEDLFQHPHPYDNWDKKALQVMLDHVTGTPGQSTAEHQRNAAKRKQLFTDYMNKIVPAELAPIDRKKGFLARGADAGGKGDFQGCSEFNPNMIFSQAEEQKFAAAADKTERNNDNRINRRVMVLIFRKGSKVDPAKWPCPRAKEGSAGCRKRFFPDGNQRRSAHLPNDRRLHEKKAETFACRFYERITDRSPCERTQPPPAPLAVGSLLASLPSTQDAASKVRPAAGTFVTANTALAFAAPAADLMVVIKDAGEITVTAQAIVPATDANRVRWQIDRDPTDTVAAGTPALDTTTGAQVKFTPTVAGSFRLICFNDANGSNKHDNGEELRVLRMVVVQITPQPGATMTLTSSFVGRTNGVSTRNGAIRPMVLQADYLLEGGGANRRFGLDQVTLGNVGNLLTDTFVANYPGRPAPNDTRNGTETEDPDFQTNPAPGFPAPMVDTQRGGAAQGLVPTGADTPFRSNSQDPVQGNGPGGNGQIKRVNSFDAPAFGWTGNHQTTGNPWATTQGTNGFREFVVAFTNTFRRNYTALGRGDWTVTVTGTANATGVWTNNGSTVTPTPTAFTTAGFPQTGDASGVQVLGLSFVREFGMIVNP